MVLAVLERRADVPLVGLDAFTMAVGGARVTEPAADLGVAVAIASSLSGRPLPADVVVCAEVGLGGELRRVANIEARLNEAARLGFRRAVIAATSPPIEAPIAVIRADAVVDALVPGLLGPASTPARPAQPVAS
jgi:DNA repair protein RadA/Sms